MYMYLLRGVQNTDLSIHFEFCYVYYMYFQVRQVIPYHTEAVHQRYFER